MKKILLFALLALAVLSCKKDDDTNNNCIEPLSISVDQINSESALVLWDPGNETAFEIEYGLTGFSTGTGTVAQTSQTNFFIDGLNPMTTYDAYVRSNCGSDGFSNYLSVSFTTLEPVNPCNTPTDLFLIDVSSSTVTFGWSENNETAWEIEYGLSGFTLGTGTVVQTSQSNFQITGLQSSTTYEIYVRANCGTEGFSEYSDQLVVTTDP
ncbi:MAG: fibronectin type III domain-containing protein [Bacteroidia bacterium]|nr:fibronectin type III domain-containing protein [Bacteroidia bacterium]MBT8275645.1 fibronectin type III domain-containing protein [Bacteroidia bacterium]NNK54288.1 fibronectin type III domain-containing protein [Flavobacteriaceae bacterium]NNM08779.1 fibronectin type III domain-containing protein [Flavobacteriaceae bacterium]